MESPYEPVEPTLFFVKALMAVLAGSIYASTPVFRLMRALPKIEAVFKKLVPSAPFDYKFVDEDYALKFAAEERISKLAGFFASLPFLFPVWVYLALHLLLPNNEPKKLVYGKILGASVFNVWRFLSKDFVCSYWFHY